MKEFFADVYFSFVPELLARFPEAENICDLSQNERSRLDGIIHEPARLSYYAAHILKRHALSTTYAGISPKAWEFTATPQGRPEILNQPPAGEIYFNISHCNGAVACMVSNIPSCGVDIEDVRRKADLKSVAEEVFSTAELARFREIRSQKPGDDTAARHFFSIWCLKEAYMKAMGLGFKINPRSFGFILSDNARISLEHKDNATQDKWQFSLHRPGNNFCLATAMQTTGDNVTKDRLLDLFGSKSDSPASPSAETMSGKAPQISKAPTGIPRKA